MRPIFRLILVALLSLPVLALIVYGGGLVRSEILLADSKRLLERRSAAYAYEKAQSAARLVSGAEVERRLYSVAYRRGRYKLALQHARESVRHSPAEARAWLRLATAKSQLRQFDYEFHYALDRAYHYGRHYDGVQLRLARLTALTWPWLDPERRRQAAASFNYILNHQYRYRFMDFLFKRERETLICPAFAATDELRDWCARTRKLRQFCSKRMLDPSLAEWCAQRGIGEK